MTGIDAEDELKRLKAEEPQARATNWRGDCNDEEEHNDYWHKRSNDIMRYDDGTDIDMFAKLQKIYADAPTQIQRDLFAFVTKILMITK